MLKPFDNSVKFGFQKFSKQSAKQNKSQNNEKIHLLTFLTFVRSYFMLQSVLEIYQAYACTDVLIKNQVFINLSQQPQSACCNTNIFLGLQIQIELISYYL